MSDTRNSANLKEWILQKADGEPIEAVVLGSAGWSDGDEIPNYHEQPKGKLLTWEEAISFIDYCFYDGFGSPRCNSIYAWTKSWVIFVSTYDGSTSPNRIPRNPIGCIPEMPGG